MVTMLHGLESLTTFYKHRLFYESYWREAYENSVYNIGDLATTIMDHLLTKLNTANVERFYANLGSCGL